MGVWVFGCWVVNGCACVCANVFGRVEWLLVMGGACWVEWLLVMGAASGGVWGQNYGGQKIKS
jgi:hypothetical protein